MNHNFARIRHEIIDKSLTNRFVHWNIHSLLDTVNDYLTNELGRKGIKERQLRDDLRVMKSDPPNGYAAPIVCDKSTGYYTYVDPNFTISKSAFSDEDVDKLNEALLILKQFESLPQFKDMQELILKLESKGGKKTEAIGNIIGFDNQKNVAGIQWLDFLYQSILQKRVLSIDYKPFTKKDAKELEIHPYFLKEYNSRWFLFGRIVPSNHVVNLALDRIQFIKVARRDYIPNTEVNFETYLSDVIGVTINNYSAKETIRLEFPAQRGKYIKTKPIHPSQKIIKESKQKLIVEISVIPNPELLTLLKSYGRDVKVLFPKSIVEELKTNLKDALQQYQ